MNEDNDYGEMYEDAAFNGEFDVESASDFFNELDPEEMAFMHEIMVPCSNCGEMRPRNDPYIVRTGCCYLCSISATHATRRSSTSNSSNNWAAIHSLVERWERSR